MAETRKRLVAGLGNPGSAYARTRHNAGFMAVDALAAHYGIRLNRTRFGAACGTGEIEGVPSVLIKPLAFMNRSGPPVRKILHNFRIPGEDMLVVHDDIDLAFGRLKIKEKGGHGGHRGLKSIMDALGGGDFNRLGIGIGRPDEGADVTEYVLSRFTDEEARAMTSIVAAAREAVATVLCQGTREGMNRFNTRRTQMSR